MPNPRRKHPHSQKEIMPQASSHTPLIFISHDSRDAELAEAFSKLLSGISAGVLKSFRSSDQKGSQGIEYGVEWYPALMKKLAAASDIVCLLTERSLDRPWILYEAGVAKGKLDSPVYGIALGIPLSKVNNGPFAQFQNCDDQEGSLTKLVLQLLARVPGSDPNHEAVQMQVGLFKRRLEGILELREGPLQDLSASSTADPPSVAKLFEEIKVMFQDLPSRVESRMVGTGIPIHQKRRHHFEPIPMLEALLHATPLDSNDPIGLLLLAGFVRDEMPLLYEPIVALYREVMNGNIDNAQRMVRTIRYIGTALNSSFWIEKMNLNPSDAEFLAREVPRVLDRYLRLVDRSDVPRATRALEQSHAK